MFVSGVFPRGPATDDGSPTEEITSFLGDAATASCPLFLRTQCGLDLVAHVQGIPGLSSSSPSSSFI